MSSTSTILIVDDLPAMSQLIASLLNDNNYQLEFAFNGHEALEKAQALSPDLILLDIMMPDMDGFAVCRSLRAMPRLATAPIILITALDDRASRLAGLEAGADDFISKPFDPSELRARVRAVTRMNRYRRLLAEQARYERLIELSPDGIFIVDSAGQIRLANPAMLRMLGADDEDQVRHRPIETFIAPANRQASRAALGTADEAPAQQRLTSWFLRRDGSTFPVEINAGRFDWDGEAMVQAIVRDITERMRFEEMLHQRNQELAILNRASQNFVSSLDLQQVLVAVLAEVGALFETASAAIWLEDAATGELVCWRASGPGSESMHGRRLAANRSLIGCTFSTGEAVLIHDVQLDTRYLPLEEAPSGQTLRSILIVPFTAQSKVFGVLQIADSQIGRFTQNNSELVEALSGIASIATENALLFRAVNAQRSQLRALAGRLAEIQEQEHQQLARELHDQLGQTLTVINLSLDLIGQILPADAPQEVQHHLHDASDLVGQAIRQVRTVMAELRPPVLDDYGLLAALRWYGQQFALRTGVATEVAECGSAMRCSPAIETALFRIAQEALNNVAKHAAASKVEISLHSEEQRIRLTIADDGRGFNVASARQATDDPHWGFLTMQERALAVGGALHVTSQPGAGATVLIEVGL
ncbi:MAG: response regulator [Anaerolineae bacterium]